MPEWLPPNIGEILDLMKEHPQEIFIVLLVVAVVYLVRIIGKIRSKGK